MGIGVLIQAAVVVVAVAFGHPHFNGTSDGKALWGVKEEKAGSEAVGHQVAVLDVPHEIYVPSRRGCCAESQHSGNRLHKGASRLLSGEGQVLFGKVIRTNRLVECGLIFAIVLSGYGAAFALGWGLFGGERLQPLWIAIGSAGPVVMLLAVICLVSGKVWVPW